MCVCVCVYRIYLDQQKLAYIHTYLCTRMSVYVCVYGIYLTYLKQYIHIHKNTYMYCVSVQNLSQIPQAISDLQQAAQLVPKVCAFV